MISVVSVKLLKLLWSCLRKPCALGYINMPHKVPSKPAWLTFHLSRRNCSLLINKTTSTHTGINTPPTNWLTQIMFLIVILASTPTIPTPKATKKVEID